ncbi:hypothetical protein B0H10DRAFT_2163467 [Mycena sp. CBHHK59/15]|nr:hypothetical protein B0H10DRAFT_2163467 [Mycena sp. CBHHK59/15]
MSRIAPNLLYLTIYNPTLQPSGPVAPDDEDAEEQAHILFYTSKERAVSRDRMLRQVGLAKALISFSDMFNADDPRHNVHSQARRMIMVSPEPNFWIHAGIDVAKTPRPPVDKAKGKGKEKDKTKADKAPPVLYDYHEYSVHDVSVQTDIMRGYERFKLRHGSFASILSTLGQQALELQLERFFTLWAWSWNLEDGPEFGEHLGSPLHPMHTSLLPLVDGFSSRLPEEVIAIAISPPYIIPSTQFMGASYPPSLPTFLLSILPPPQEPIPPPPIADNSTIKAPKAQPAPEPDLQRQRESPKREEDSKSFLGMNLDINVKMDMPKWNWPGYLTFGKGGKKPPEFSMMTPRDENKGESSVAGTPGVSEQTINFAVDRSALEDAMFPDRIPLPVEKPADAGDAHSVSETIMPRKQDNVADISNATQGEDSPEVAPPTGNDIPEETSGPEPSQFPESEPVVFSSITVHLASPEDPQATRRRRVFYLIRDHILVALLGLDDPSGSLEPDPTSLSPLAEQVSALAASIKDTMDDLALKSAVDFLPSATKILQQKDRYAVASSHFTICSVDFESRSDHLYNAQEMLHASDPDISEVFSRGQNPQHWHIAQRDVGGTQGATDGEVYMEVFRKETSLTDVDNALAGVVRKSAFVPQ